VTNVEAGVDAEVSAPSSRPPRTRREQFEQRQRRRSTIIAATSTVVVVAAIVVLIPRFDSWPRVRRAFFDGDIFSSSFGEILSAFWLDVRIFAICAPLILVFGLAVALAKNARSPVLFPVRLFATMYTDIVRGVPVILWLYIIGIGVVGLLNSRSFFGSYLFWGSVGLVVTYTAYVAEVFRAGIEGIHESQRAGARSLGLSTWQTNRFVVLPQAVRRVVPPLINDFVSLQKDVALISLLGPVEALRRADVIQDETFNYTPYVVAALLFLCVSIPLTRTADYLLAKERRRTSGTAVR
jgi:polar amino acid transport system permease protein